MVSFKMCELYLNFQKLKKTKKTSVFNRHAFAYFDLLKNLLKDMMVHRFLDIIP